MEEEKSDQLYSVEAAKSVTSVGQWLLSPTAARFVHFLCFSSANHVRHSSSNSFWSFWASSGSFYLCCFISIFFSDFSLCRMAPSLQSASGSKKRWCCFWICVICIELSISPSIIQKDKLKRFLDQQSSHFEYYLLFCGVMLEKEAVGWFELAVAISTLWESQSSKGNLPSARFYVCPHRFHHGESLWLFFSLSVRLMARFRLFPWINSLLKVCSSLALPLHFLPDMFSIVTLLYCRCCVQLLLNCVRVSSTILISSTKIDSHSNSSSENSMLIPWFLYLSRCSVSRIPFVRSLLALLAASSSLCSSLSYYHCRLLSELESLKQQRQTLTESTTAKRKTVTQVDTLVAKLEKVRPLCLSVIES